MPAPPPFRAAAHRRRLEEAQKEYEAAERLQAEIKRELDEFNAAAKPYETHFQKQMDQWFAAHDKLANNWLAVAQRVREFMVSDPALARFGPTALIAIGLSRLKKRKPDSAPPDDAEPSIPRGPK